MFTRCASCTDCATSEGVRGVKQVKTRNNCDQPPKIDLPPSVPSNHIVVVLMSRPELQAPPEIVGITNMCIRLRSYFVIDSTTAMQKPKSIHQSMSKNI